MPEHRTDDRTDDRTGDRTGTADVPPYVACDVRDDIAYVRLVRPAKLNALTLDTIRELARTAHALRADRSLRAVVLSGAGDSFCAGLDFGTVGRDPRGIARSFVPLPWRGTNGFQEACWAWRRLPVPVLAAVHGHCFGGGLQLALSADLRFAAPESQWSVLEGRWGLIPDMTGIVTLRELVGIDVAKQLTMTAERFDGTRAYELGLVTELTDDPVAAATAYAERLRQSSPDAVAAAKRLFNTGWTAHPRLALARERIAQAGLFRSQNTATARKAAMARELPSYGPRSRR